MNVTANNGKVERLLALLGPAVLLPWPSRSKGGNRKWKHRGLSDMDDATYLAKIEKAGNIGVALGNVSAGLVTIDLDDDKYVGAFLQANPPLTQTLRTYASRGCNIWVRCSDGYPASQKLKNSSGSETGEWRADGNQTIIAGIHPNGMPYQVVVENPVITIGYKAIVWPDSFIPPDATESKRVRGVRRVRGEEGVGENKVVCVGVCEQQMQLYFPADRISQIAPKDYRQNNRSLFKLAQLMKSYQVAVGRPALPSELQAAFDCWALVARPYWRTGRTRDDYYIEFLDAYGYARMGLDENPFEVAVCRAKAAPLPQVEGITDERIRLLVAICQELQNETGANPFFVPTRKLGEILGVHYTQAAQWLRVLVVLGIIHLALGETRKRGGNRSPRYVCGSRLKEREALVSSIAPSLSKSHVHSTPLALLSRKGV